MTTTTTTTKIIPRLARIKIERTKTSKEALALEELYFPKIKKIFKQIVTEYGEGDRFFFLYEAERRYGEEIRAIIKSLVTKTYLLGMEYVERATRKPQYISLSPNDVTQILVRADEAYRMFWRLVTKHIQVKRNKDRIAKNNNNGNGKHPLVKRIAQIHRMPPSTLAKEVLLTDELFGVSDWEDERLLEEDTNTELIINGIVTTTLALATLEKYKEYKTQQEEIFMEEELFIEEEFGEIITEEEGEGEEGEADTVIFATEMDDRVCDICSSLEGEEWEVDDPSIVIPRDMTHPNCRCRLILRINGNVKAH